jgi:Domain of unknown function (DUF397)
MTISANDGLEWIKSSRSMSSGACVELAASGDLIALRDSKNPHLAPLYYSHAEIGAFLYAAKRGEFDHLVGEI